MMAAAAAATTSIPPHFPHMSLPHIPRIRPPRIPKGTPNANSLPQPPGPVPPGPSNQWVQGKWRNPSSNAAIDRRAVQSRRVERALRHSSHGQIIYAYNNIRTNQVVYSLTRILENNKILPQLLYHGKKTVPASLRRDHWTPFFSLHFPRDADGSSPGLKAYRILRELSVTRQLSPPDDMVMTTQEDIDKIEAKYDPVELETLKEQKKLKTPRVGQYLPKKLRARNLMDQKATSVADVAFVLGLFAENDGLSKKGKPSWDFGDSQRVEERRAHAWKRFLAQRGEGEKELGTWEKRRLRKQIRQYEAFDRNLAARSNLAKETKPGNVGLDVYAQKRISMEYLGGRGKHEDLVLGPRTTGAEQAEMRLPETDLATAEGGSSDAEQPGTSGRESTGSLNVAETPSSRTTSGEEAKSDTANPSYQEQAGSPAEHSGVRILWSDLRDAKYAATWPDLVRHAELERAAVARTRDPGVSSHAYEVFRGTSVHAMGGQQGRGWYRPTVVSTDRPAEKEEKPVVVGAESAPAGEAPAAASETVQGPEEAAQALKEKGIMIETPSRGVWQRVKRLFLR